MRRLAERIVIAGLLAATICPMRAQNTKAEFWPELDFYVQLNESVRLDSENAFNQDQSTQNKQGSFSYWIDVALKPVFRRELRRNQDVFRRRYLTFRAGYQYTTSFENGKSASKDVILTETTWKAPLPNHFVFMDRNRGEFRFIRGQGFSMRYRNRIWLERDLKIGEFVFTPFVYDEFFYDTGKSAWVPNRYAAGVQIPAGEHIVFEPYYARQNDRLSTPQHLNALGLKFRLYF